MRSTRATRGGEAAGFAANEVETVIRVERVRLRRRFQTSCALKAVVCHRAGDRREVGAVRLANALRLGPVLREREARAVAERGGAGERHCVRRSKVRKRGDSKSDRRGVRKNKI